MGSSWTPRFSTVGRRFFDMNEPNLNAVAQDGRYFLTNSPRRYDVIAVDAYRPPYIPFHLTTKEFFTEVHRHLTEHGVLAINVGRTMKGRDLINVLSSTARAVFPHVYVIDTPDYGSDAGEQPGGGDGGRHATGEFRREPRTDGQSSPARGGGQFRAHDP